MDHLELLRSHLMDEMSKTLKRELTRFHEIYGGEAELRVFFILHSGADTHCPLVSANVPPEIIAQTLKLILENMSEGSFSMKTQNLGTEEKPS